MYTDCNGNPLQRGEIYMLRTYTDSGDITPPSEWLATVWNGEHLDDMEGCYWDEWLPTPLDIVPADYR